MTEESEVDKAPPENVLKTFKCDIKVKGYFINLICSDIFCDEYKKTHYRNFRSVQYLQINLRIRYIK